MTFAPMPIPCPVHATPVYGCGTCPVSERPTMAAVASREYMRGVSDGLADASDLRALLERVRACREYRTGGLTVELIEAIDAALAPPPAGGEPRLASAAPPIDSPVSIRTEAPVDYDGRRVVRPMHQIFQHSHPPLEVRLSPKPSGGEPQPAPERVCPCCANGGGSTACWCAEWCPGHNWSLPPSAPATAEVPGVERETQPRVPGCACHLEEGDSPCPVHGDHSGDTPAPTAEVPGVGTLLPCPFCGGPASAFWHEYVDCPACGAFGPDRTPDASAEALWNRRAPTAEERAVVIEHAPRFEQELGVVMEERDAARAELAALRAAHEETVRGQLRLLESIEAHAERTLGASVAEKDRALDWICGQAKGARRALGDAVKGGTP